MSLTVLENNDRLWSFGSTSLMTPIYWLASRRNMRVEIQWTIHCAYLSNIVISFLSSQLTVCFFNKFNWSKGHFFISGGSCLSGVWISFCQPHENKHQLFENTLSSIKLPVMASVTFKVVKCLLGKRERSIVQRNIFRKFSNEVSS